MEPPCARRPCGRARSWSFALALAPLCLLVAASDGHLPPLPASYLSPDEMGAFAAALHAAAPDLVTAALRIGVSVEGRDIVAFCVGSSCPAIAPGAALPAAAAASAAASSPGSALLVTALHHGREPAGAVAALQLAHALVAGVLAGDPRSVALARSRRVWVVPCVNPDAYVANLLAHTMSPRLDMARKNRRPGCALVASGQRAYDALGVDLNRNYDFAFALDSEGSSTDACAEDYRGPAAFSEPETAAVRDFVAWLAAGVSGDGADEAGANAGNLTVALNWHSYARFINVPYAVRTPPQPRDALYAGLLSVAGGMAAATAGDGGAAGYTFGHPWSGLLYTCNGEASDWMVRRHSVLAFSPEIGPDMHFDPFSAGMWPAPEAATAAPEGLPRVVAEGAALHRYALWAAGSFVRAFDASARLSLSPGPADESGSARPRARTLSVVLENRGAVPAAGALVVTLMHRAAPLLTATAASAAAQGVAYPLAGAGAGGPGGGAEVPAVPASGSLLDMLLAASPPAAPASPCLADVYALGASAGAGAGAEAAGAAAGGRRRLRQREPDSAGADAGDDADAPLLSAWQLARVREGRAAAEAAALALLVGTETEAEAEAPGVPGASGAGAEEREWRWRQAAARARIGLGPIVALATQPEEGEGGLARPRTLSDPAAADAPLASPLPIAPLPTEQVPAWLGSRAVKADGLAAFTRLDPARLQLVLGAPAPPSSSSASSSSDAGATAAAVADIDAHGFFAYLAVSDAQVCAVYGVAPPTPPAPPPPSPSRPASPSPGNASGSGAAEDAGAVDVGLVLLFEGPAGCLPCAAMRLLPAVNGSALPTPSPGPAPPPSPSPFASKGPPVRPGPGSTAWRDVTMLPLAPLDSAPGGSLGGGLGASAVVALGLLLGAVGTLLLLRRLGLASALGLGVGAEGAASAASATSQAGGASSRIAVGSLGRSRGSQGAAQSQPD